MRARPDSSADPCDFGDCGCLGACKATLSERYAEFPFAQPRRQTQFTCGTITVPLGLYSLT